MTWTIAFLLSAIFFQTAAPKPGPWKYALRRQDDERVAHLQDRQRPEDVRRAGAKDCWEIVNGVLQKDGHANDIASKDQFGDFELELEWKIGDASNSGVFYRGTDEFNQIYWSAPDNNLDTMNAADNKKDNHLAGLSTTSLPSKGGRKARRRVEPDADRRKGNPRRHGLNGQKVASTTSAVPTGMPPSRPASSTREISRVWESAEGLSRHPGRSSRDAGTAQHQNP